MNLLAITLHFTIIVLTATFTILEISVNLLMGYGSLYFIERVKEEGEKFHNFSSNLYKTATAYHKTTYIIAT